MFMEKKIWRFDHNFLKHIPLGPDFPTKNVPCLFFCSQDHLICSHSLLVKFRSFNKYF